MPRNLTNLFWSEHSLLGVGSELVPLLAVGEAQSEGHLLLCPIDSGGLLQRRDFRILAFVRIDLKRKAVSFLL